VHFTADAALIELLEEVRALSSHREPKLDLATLIKRSLEVYKRELRKIRFGAGRKPRRVERAKARSERVGQGEQGHPKEREEPRRPRRVPAAIAREVYLRDGGECTFCSSDGRRCGSRDFLQLDHVQPWARGGEATVENLRLRCRGHNLQAARNEFGDEHVSAAIERGRSPRKARKSGDDVAPG
jgi:5-methylcytosine-specific restriction endonuclease McrA